MIDFLLGTRERRATTETGLSLQDVFSELSRGRKTSAGQSITEENATQLSAYWCGMNIIADAFKSVPMNLYQRLQPRGRDKLDTDPRVRLLKLQPNREMTPSRFKALVAWWSGCWGNFLAEIERTNSDRPLALWPIHPSRVKKYRSPDGSIWFEVYNDKGVPTYIPDKDMIHVFRHSKDGLWGISNVGVARESLGLAVAADQYGARFFGGNAMPSTLVTAKDAMEKPELDQFRKEWVEAYSGENSGGVGFLGGADDIKIQTLTIPNEDAQFLQTRQYQVTEMARWLIISPFRLKDFGRATWGNSSEESTYFASETIRPYAIDLEEELDRKLLSESERPQTYFEMNLAGLLRGDIKSESEVLERYIRVGMYSVDDARDKINENPLPDGQGNVYTRESNLTPAKVMQAQADAASDAPVDDPAKPPANEPPADDAPNRAAIDAAFSSVFTATGARLARVESDKMSRKVKDAEAYTKWRDAFPAEHRDRVRSEFEPVVTAYAAALRRSVDPATIEAVVTEYLVRLGVALKTADPDEVAKARPTDWIMARACPQEVV